MDMRVRHWLAVLAVLGAILLTPDGVTGDSVYTGTEHKEDESATTADDKSDEKQCEKNCTGIKADENYYFDGYADIHIHEQMISDTARTNAYRNAIFGNEKLLKDAVVVDVGAGTGILSVFCVQAGARKVYAIEASSLSEMTQKIVDANGMEDKITVISKKVEIAELPEQVDVIVSEWMGYSLLFENMLPTVLLARDKWLKKGGAILPDKADLYMAPFTSDGYYDERLTFWDGVQSTYHVDMSPLKEHARKCVTAKPYSATIEIKDILAGSNKIQHFDLTTMTVADLKEVKSTFSFSTYSATKVYGFTIWFDVDFPGGVTLSTSPFQKFLDIILQFSAKDRDNESRNVQKTYVMDA